MKALLLKSNHGNHSGFNRKWEILSKFDDSDSQVEVEKEIDRLVEKYDLTKEEVPKLYFNWGFEFDLYYYKVVTQDDYDNGHFDGGHYGYAPKSVIKYFEDEMTN